MAQISPTLRIVFVVTLAFVIVWFAALKPKGPAEDPAPAAASPSAPQSDAGVAKHAAEKARDTAQADVNRAGATGTGSTVSAATATGATATRSTSPSTSTSTGTAAKPALAPPVSDAALDKLPRPVSTALRERDVLVLFFHDGGRSADDQAVRRAVARIGRQHGHLRTHSAKLDSISRYASVTRGVAVTQSPTVVVVDKHRKTEMLVGFVDTRTIEQAAADALRASGYRFDRGE